VNKAEAMAAESPHYRLTEERPLPDLKAGGITILFGGLTAAHERLVEGAWEGLGYRVKALPEPDNEALGLGREYCNRGMCNPAYYTVGNLLKYLFRLRRAGVPEIEERFAYLTAGSCGPCRFGMYEAEFRRALTQAGFPGVRVLVIQQRQGLLQTGADGSTPFERPFVIALVRALMLGDLLNELGHALRPYEAQRGTVDEALDEGRRWLYWALRDHENPGPVLRRIRRRLDAIELDYLRVKPKVKVTGEFWAQTTEGDGSYHLARWLEQEGAEVIVEPVGTWVEYLLWSRMRRNRDRRGIHTEGRDAHSTRLEMRLRLGQVLFDSVYNTYRAALGFRTEPLASIDILARYAEAYYNTRIEGGEAFMEVAKTVFSIRRRKAHMVVSIKPFGCLPSTQSDGVQVKVLADHPEALFVAVETSGDGEVHVRSRIQMFLREARERAQQEFDGTVEKLGLQATLGDASKAARLPRPTATAPLPRRAIGSACNYLWWLTRPGVLRGLPLPTEGIAELLRRRRRGTERG
jgi:predicted nucleotide-binding protein (sugar kinase/HSP70/actin superfamily)